MVVGVSVAYLGDKRVISIRGLIGLSDNAGP